MAGCVATWDGVQSMIRPALLDIQGGTNVIGCDIQTDFLHDRLEIGVRHILLTRRELDNADWKRVVGPRLRRALLVDATSVAKEIRMQRRQLMLRGDTARKLKAKVK